MKRIEAGERRHFPSSPRMAAPQPDLNYSYIYETGFEPQSMMPFVCGLVSCLGLIFAVIRTAPAHTKAALSLGTPLPPCGPAPRRGHICAEVALPSGCRTGRVQTASGNKKCQVVLTSRPAEPRGWDPNHTGLPPTHLPTLHGEQHRAWGGGA